MQFDYFYGGEAEQFSFFRIPKLLFRDENGHLLVIHCSAGASNVVITDREGFAWPVKVAD